MLASATAMTGITRRLIESPTPHKFHESYRAELIRLVSAFSHRLRTPGTLAAISDLPAGESLGFNLFRRLLAVFNAS